jgi:ribonuclease P protein component
MGMHAPPVSLNFRKYERLYNISLIQKLFQSSHLSAFPLKLYYLPISETKTHQILISVPKRNFKKAHDRNRLKRQLKEIYRLQKNLLYEISQEQKYALGLLYIGKKAVDYQELVKAYTHILEKLKQNIPTNKSTMPE